MSTNSERLGRAFLSLILAGGLAHGWSVAVAAATPQGGVIRCAPAGDEPFGAGVAAHLRCDLSGTGNLDDSLTILKRQATGPGSAAWPRADTADSTWIFDRRDDGEAELIVDFHAAGSAVVADLYDAQGRPGRLRHSTDGGVFRLADPLPPTVEVRAPEGWWEIGGRINMNLRLAVDGRVDAAFDVLRKVGGKLATDGRQDFEIEIGDTDGDGRPDYDWRTLDPPAGLLQPIEQTYLMVNACGNETPLAPMLPWPLLGSVTYGYLTVSPQPVSRPPIQVDWDTGTIVTLGEFVRSRGNDCQWFVYSFRRAVAGVLNATDFESPFAWYDVSGDHNRVPELSVRVLHYPAWDEHILAGAFQKPINAIRYSWDQDNDGNWDYKLALIGFNAVTSTVELPPLSLQMVPYDEVPTWVTSNTWAGANFVADETGEASGEGIYVWDYPAWYIGQYVTGRRLTPTPPDTLTAIERDFREYGWGTIPAGFRGEHRDELDDKPRLYGSPVDRKLHLLNADGGTWQVDDTAIVQYANLDGGPSIDQWRFQWAPEGASPISSELDVSADHLVYFGDDGVAIRRAAVPPTAFEALPPATPDEWQRLGSRIQALGPQFGPGDFREMMAAFDGPEVFIPGATGRSYRATEDGFRFVLELPPNSEVQGPDLVGLAGLTPGRYLVTWNGSFEVEPLAPPRPWTSVAAVSRAQALTLAAADVTVGNLGLEDLLGARLDLIVTAPDGKTGTAASEPTDLLAGQTHTVSLRWAPDLPGRWLLTSRIEAPDGSVTLSDPVGVDVAPTITATGLELLALSAGPFKELALAALLGLLATLASVTMARAWLTRARA